MASTSLTVPNFFPYDVYGEFHTGKSWAEAVAQHVITGSGDMPVGLVVYIDKSHFDTHGGLCVTPISFTLTLFNKEARNSKKFWRPLAYLPNLDQHIIDDSDDETEPNNEIETTTAAESLQDEQKCLSVALQSLKLLHRQGGGSCDRPPASNVGQDLDPCR